MGVRLKKKKKKKKLDVLFDDDDRKANADAFLSVTRLLLNWVS